MIKQKIKAFTLVELIVVITILAILGTIAFISFTGYQKSSRDSTRIADLSSLTKSIEIYNVNTGKYPIPSNPIDIEYSGSLVWEQGTVGDSLITNIKNLNKKPTDPLTGNEYSYSVTKNKNEYQVAGILEDYLLGNNSINSANAADFDNIKAVVKGQYTSKGIMVKNGVNCETITTPSIILANTGNGSSYNLTGSIDFVINNSKNIADSYKFKIDETNRTSGNNFNITSIYDKCSIETQADIDEYVTNLGTAYNQYAGTPEAEEFSDIINGTNIKGVKIEAMRSLKKTGVVVLESVIKETLASVDTGSPSGGGTILFSDDFDEPDWTYIEDSTPEVGFRWSKARDASYYISKLNNGNWENIIKQNFPTRYDTKSFKIENVDENNLKLRFVQKNIEFGSIDKIELMHCNEVIEPEYAVYTKNNESVLEKILKDDNRVADAHEIEKEIEVSWNLINKCEGKTFLTLKANEYGSNGVQPLKTTKTNIDFSKIENIENVNIDGEINEVDGIKEYDYKDFWKPTTGHPDNYTYYYFSQDKDNLYLHTDITIDNTEDLDIDWAEITIYGENEEEYVFKIDDNNYSWGKCGFGITSKTIYEHQYCEFKIPKKDFKTKNNNKLDFSFRYYGTAGGGGQLVISDNKIYQRDDGYWSDWYYPWIDNTNSQISGNFEIEFDYVRIDGTIRIYLLGDHINFNETFRIVSDWNGLRIDQGKHGGTTVTVNGYLTNSGTLRATYIDDIITLYDNGVEVITGDVSGLPDPSRNHIGIELYDNDYDSGSGNPPSPKIDNFVVRQL